MVVENGDQLCLNAILASVVNPVAIPRRCVLGRVAICRLSFLGVIKQPFPLRLRVDLVFFDLFVKRLLFLGRRL